MSRGRRTARLVLVAAAVAGALAIGVRADAADEPAHQQESLLSTVIEGAASLAFSDGDYVVYETEAKGAGGNWDRPVRHDGFSTYGDAQVLDEYDILLVSSAGIEQLRPHLARAAGEAMAAGAPPLTMIPGTVAEGTPMEHGEIHVIVSSWSPCSGQWLGCGGPVVDDGVVVAARIWINPRLFRHDASHIGNTSRHELGHAMGLGHYDEPHDGRLQTMHPSSFEATAYEAGDRAGLRFVTGNEGPDPQRAPVPGPANVRTPPPPPPPRSVDPMGAVEVAGSTPFGLAVAGWALDPDSSSPISVLVTVDGAPIETVADRPRADGTSNGFGVLYPVAPGTHEVCVMLRNAGPGTDVRLGCRAVDISARSIGRVGLQTV